MLEKGKHMSVLVDFLIVNVDIPYNVIIRWPILNQVKAAISTNQHLLQFQADDGKVVQLFGD